MNKINYILIAVAVAVIIIGFLLVIVGIMYRPKEKE